MDYATPLAQDPGSRIFAPRVIAHGTHASSRFAQSDMN
jgi:hypothetical protein